MANRTTPKAARPMPFDRLPPKQARRQEVPIQHSEDNAERLAAAMTAMASPLATEAERAALVDELEAARAAAQATTVVYRFRALSQPAYEALVAMHPPTAEQVAEYEAKVAAEAKKDIGERSHVEPPWADEENLAPALIAACMYDPEMTEDQVRAYFGGDDWNAAEVQSLYQAAVNVNTTLRRASAGKGSGSTRG